MVLVVPGVVVLLDEAKVLLPLPLEDAVSPLGVSWEVTLGGGGGGDKRSRLRNNAAPQSFSPSMDLFRSGRNSLAFSSMMKRRLAEESCHKNNFNLDLL